MRQSPTSSSASCSSSFVIQQSQYYCTKQMGGPWTVAVILLLQLFLTLATYWKVSSLIPSHTMNDPRWIFFRTLHHVDSTTEEQSSLAAVAAAFPSVDEVASAQFQRTFPIHTTNRKSIQEDDQEVIVHPAYEAMDARSQQEWPTDLAWHVTVPKFLDESSYGKLFGGSIRQFLGDGKRRMTPQEASRIGSRISSTDDGENEMLETIYCSITSYRDPECSRTIADLFEQATHPERIRVAIVDQRRDGDPICGIPHESCELEPDQTLCRYGHLIDRMELDARLACGPVFARHLAHRHYRGEYFAMQIDAHVRFVLNWDTDLVAMWKSANNEMAVLSYYLSDVDGINQETHEAIKKGRAVMCESDFEGREASRHLRHGVQPERVAYIRGQPTLQPYWAAGFSFARGHFVVQVPYDQHLPMVFQGEEISIGIRGFTYGYDYYTPERPVCFHIYAVRSHKDERKKVPKFWENQSMYHDLGTKSMKRLNTIIQMEQFDSDWSSTLDQEKYGLGAIRDPQKFFDTFGIHVKEKKVEKHLCRFVGEPMMTAFIHALRKDRMGLDYEKIDYKFVDPDPSDKIVI